MRPIATTTARTVALVALLLLVTIAPASAMSASKLETQVVSSTNVQRHHLGRKTLGTNSCLNKYADRQARWMASRELLVHQSMQVLLRKCGMRAVAENIAFGFSSGGTTVDAWMNSPGHRTNILRPNMKLIGVGAYQSASGQWWVSQLFGTKM